MRRVLLLMRHAEAARGGGPGGDHARALSARGREQARAAGTWLEGRAAGLTHPGAAAPPLALSSSARRAVETLEALRETCPWLREAEVRIGRELYLADSEGLLEALGALGEEPRAVVLVGHNPGIGTLAAALARAGDAGALARLRSGFPPAALALLELAPRWIHAARGGALLGAFAPP